MVWAHIFFCMLSYTVQWERERKPAPPLPGRRQMQSLNEPAPLPKRISEITLKKEQNKRSAEGQHPVQSFQSLMENLATLSEVTCCPRVEGAESFRKYPIATNIQSRAYQLLGLPLPDCSHKTVH
jgi:hypothetical protein